jgi:hypothetical protein
MLCISVDAPVVQGHMVDHGCDFHRPIESSVFLSLCSGLLVEHHYLVKDIFVYKRFLNSTSPVHGSIVVRNYSSNILIGLRY